MAAVRPARPAAGPRRRVQASGPRRRKPASGGRGAAAGEAAGASGLRDGARALLRHGPEREGGAGPRSDPRRTPARLFPPHDQQRHHGTQTRRPAALPEGDQTRARRPELRLTRDAVGHMMRGSV